MNNEIIKHTEASHELVLFTTNDYATYTRAIQPAIRCLAKKYRAGTFDAEKAVKQFYHVATYAAKEYAREFCDKATAYYKVFSTADRRAAAADLLDYFMEDIESAAEE